MLRNFWVCPGAPTGAWFLYVFVILMFLFIVLTVLLWPLLSLIFFWDFEWKENSCPKLAMVVARKISHGYLHRLMA